MPIQGQRFEITFTAQNDLSYGTSYVQIAEMPIEQWDQVGIKAILNSVDSSTHSIALRNNTIECVIFTGEGGAGVTAFIEPRYYVPLYSHCSYFGHAR
ncbi:MAG: hypothetical protein ACOYYS_13325 [Chloroflexota bacterium]